LYRFSLPESKLGELERVRFMVRSRLLINIFCWFTHSRLLIEKSFSGPLINSTWSLNRGPLTFCAAGGLIRHEGPVEGDPNFARKTRSSIRLRDARERVLPITDSSQGGSSGKWKRARGHCRANKLCDANCTNRYRLQATRQARDRTRAPSQRTALCDYRTATKEGSSRRSTTSD
jgi:hypothetical protein